MDLKPGFGLTQRRVCFFSSLPSQFLGFSFWLEENVSCKEQRSPAEYEF
jgi:hypothetical protein